MVQESLSATFRSRLCGRWSPQFSRAGTGNSTRSTEEGLRDITCQHHVEQWHTDRASQTKLFGATEFHSENREAMFNLSGAVRYKYIPNYKDMRGGYDKLSGVIRSLGQDPDDGTAYVFTSRDQKLVKIIRHENNECQLFIQRFDNNMSLVRLTFDGTSPLYVLEWKYIVALLSCPVVRKIRAGNDKLQDQQGIRC